MQKMSDYLGVEIRAAKTDKKLGEISDFSFKPGDTKLRGVIGIGMGLLKSRFFLPVDGIVSLEEEKLVADSEKIRQLKRNEHLEEYGNIIGLAVEDDTHYYNGRIAEVYFSPVSFEVYHTTIKRGFLDDMITGREVVPVSSLAISDKGLTVVSKD